MATTREKKQLEQLFDHHLQNLQGVCPKAGEVFVCPICFKVFSRKALTTKLLSIGHVWPKHICRHSEKAKHQTVILCKDCNSQAGGHGDRMMQEVERVREGEKSGNRYKPRAVWVRPTPGIPGEFAKLRAEVNDNPEKKRFDLILKAGKGGQPLYDPKELRKAERYFQQGNCTIMIHPPDDINWQLAQAGWLTSAYLLGFYAFGYRYIFQSCLDYVREYIEGSFVLKVDDRLSFREDKSTSVRTCITHFNNDPEIVYLNPSNEDLPYHLEFSFLDYHIRLPLQYMYKLTLSETIKADANVRGIEVRGSDHVAHKNSGFCHWDFLFGEPNYFVQGFDLMYGTTSS